MRSEKNHNGRWPEKAYKNLAFLNSPDARIVRILCEFLEPGSRFRRNRIHDTIVFFGSARVLPRDEAIRDLERLRAEIASKKRPAQELRDALAQAEVRV
ncbi:MAG: hypothetical protein WC655_01910, partial [Candidatus Hydrogenedentales bacterium]